jgi:hypothetical protein
MSPQIRFITANDASLARLICRDAGPTYAESLHLPWANVEALMAHPAWTKDTIIIDHVLNDAEVPPVREFIERQSTLVFLKVVDSYWSRATKGKNISSYSRLVETHCAFPNVAILTPYEPREWLKSTVDQNKARVLILPFPYVTAAERPITLDNFAARFDRAILTGALSGRKYPRRAMVRRLRYFLPRYRKNFDLLGHPGYPNLGEARRHRLIYDEFVKYIAGYKYFFVCPSRADMEFLKYTECAYAGCFPIGAPAASLPAAAQRLFLDTGAFLNSMREPAAARDRRHYPMALEYRKIMAESRRSEALRERLIAFARAMQ